MGQNGSVDKEPKIVENFLRIMASIDSIREKEVIFAKSCVKWGAAPFGYPHNKQALCHPAGSIAPFVVSSPFHGLRVVPCKLT